MDVSFKQRRKFAFSDSLMSKLKTDNPEENLIDRLKEPAEIPTPFLLLIIFCNSIKMC